MLLNPQKAGYTKKSRAYLDEDTTLQHHTKKAFERIYGVLLISDVFLLPGLDSNQQPTG